MIDIIIIIFNSKKMNLTFDKKDSKHKKDFNFKFEKTNELNKNNDFNSNLNGNEINDFECKNRTTTFNRISNINNKDEINHFIIDNSRITIKTQNNLEKNQSLKIKKIVRSLSGYNKNPLKNNENYTKDIFSKNEVLVLDENLEIDESYFERMIEMENKIKYCFSNDLLETLVSMYKYCIEFYKLTNRSEESNGFLLKMHSKLSEPYIIQKMSETVINKSTNNNNSNFKKQLTINRTKMRIRQSKNNLLLNSNDDKLSEQSNSKRINNFDYNVKELVYSDIESQKSNLNKRLQERRNSKLKSSKSLNINILNLKSKNDVESKKSDNESTNSEKFSLDFNTKKKKIVSKFGKMIFNNLETIEEYKYIKDKNIPEMESVKFLNENDKEYISISNRKVSGMLFHIKNDVFFDENEEELRRLSSMKTFVMKSDLKQKSKNLIDNDLFVTKNFEFNNDENDLSKNDQMDKSKNNDIDKVENNQSFENVSELKMFNEFDYTQLKSIDLKNVEVEDVDKKHENDYKIEENKFNDQRFSKLVDFSKINLETSSLKKEVDSSSSAFNLTINAFRLNKSKCNSFINISEDFIKDFIDYYVTYTLKKFLKDLIDKNILIFVKFVESYKDNLKKLKETENLIDNISKIIFNKTFLKNLII